ncbi:MAG: triose-phosphate isomerase [Candidatus Kuenenbacteria bacterium]
MLNKKKLVIANWKMNLSHREAVDLAYDIAEFRNRNDIEAVLCPCFASLVSVAEAISDSSYFLGAQDAFYHQQGSYTGEMSPRVLKEIGCDFVIVGHSERRQYLGESDEDVNRKVRACLENRLIPIMCVGETLDDRREGLTDLTIIRQITKGLEDIEFKKNQRLVIAYEPVWAISPAQPAHPKDVKEVLQIINSLLLDFFEAQALDDNITLIYGGAVDGDDVNKFIDGFCNGVIVGAQSLKAENFIRILRNIKEHG